MMVENADLQILLKISPEQLSTFLHKCVDDLCSNTSIENSLPLNNIELSPEDFKKARISVHKFYKKCVIDGYPENLKISSIIEEALKRCYEIREKEILNVVAKDVLIKNGLNLVENIDWRLKWIMGTSTLASYKEPVTQVDLNYIKMDSSREKTTRDVVNFEANLDQIDSLIGELTKVQNELQS